MKWEALHSDPCPIARTVAVIGDRWTLLLLRDCFLGISRFEAFQARLGISRTIIAERLHTLVTEGVLRRVPYQDAPVRHDYVLTPKGLELYPILISMIHWGNKQGGRTLQLRHRCGKRLRPILTCEDCGAAIEAPDVKLGAPPSKR